MGGAEPPRHKLFADVTWTRVNCNYLYLTVGLLHFATRVLHPSLRAFPRMFSFSFSANTAATGTINFASGGTVSLEIHYGFVEIPLYRDLRAEAVGQLYKASGRPRKL